MMQINAHSHAPTQKKRVIFRYTYMKLSIQYRIFSSTSLLKLILRNALAHRRR